MTSFGEMPAILTSTLSRTLFMRSRRAARSSECAITALFLARSQRSLVAWELTLPTLPAGLSAGLGAGALNRPRSLPTEAAASPALAVGTSRRPSGLGVNDPVLRPPDCWLCAIDALSAAQRSLLPGVDGVAFGLRWARDSWRRVLMGETGTAAFEPSGSWREGDACATAPSADGLFAAAGRSPRFCNLFPPDRGVKSSPAP